MALKPRIIELKQLETDLPKTVLGQHLLSVELTWPRPGIELKQAVRRVKFASKPSFDWSRTPLSEKMVHKEKVDGRYGIKVSLTEHSSDSRLESLLEAFALGSVRVGAELAEDSAPLGFKYLLRGVRKELQDQLEEAFDEGPDFLGEGEITIPTEKTGMLEVPLYASQTIYENTSQPRRSGRPGARGRGSAPKRGKALIKAGKRLASLQLNLEEM